MSTYKLNLIEKVSTNKIYAGVHWIKRKKIKDIYRLEVMRIFKRVKPIKCFPIKLTYKFEFKGRLLDTSNCSFMAKMIEDGLVKCGIIVDDSPKYVGDIVFKKPIKGKEDVCYVTINENK